ncbi:AMP-binding protein [Actinokineospora globicatena]|uniref:AMP-dependent synthetase and ligase n=1 Tax=Actinokineospora globicatena TaxID=103729 RepID=A0A9W6QFQ9_9PSEU|nr:AMP-binding protein [Actinokineospora globicatena]GLW90136.1 AMP-dependent synthetase and ligase [Actinokineospora globicatena]
MIVDYRALGRTTRSRVGLLDSVSPLAATTGQDLFDDARAVAGALAERGLGPGDRAVLVVPTGLDHLVVLVGCLLAGVAPCTVAAPTNPADPNSAGTRHVRAAIEVIRPGLVVAMSAHIDNAVTVADLRRGPTPRWDDFPEPAPEQAHHIQLTSGSTSAPKAVVLTHANVAANLGALRTTSGAEAGRDRVLSWLPLYHDMGLVQVLLALSTDLDLDLMAPTAFLRDPTSWPRHMAARRATLTAAPPFAYRTAADRHVARPDPGLDLSALRQAYVGAEPIPVSALRSFHDAFTGAGLADDVLVPCYGMAETVLATTVALRSSERNDFGRVRTTPFEGRRLVSCGRPVPGTELRLLDAGGAPVAPGAVGTIHVRGDSVMAGYLTVEGPQAPVDGWHDTGDLGLLDDGDLFVVGRVKELLIVRGRNLPPYDVEEVVEQHPLVGPGSSAVFSYATDDGVTESVVAVVETRARDEQWPGLRTEVATAVRQAFGLSLADVVIRRRLPRTSSGKRQRSALRAAYLADLG